eukprot:gene19972-21930_t
MGKEKERKTSKFLVDLDKYYMARRKRNQSFSSVACPQNFIPGATKAKMPNRTQAFRTASRKVSSVCFQGVLVRMKDNMTTVEKGVAPAALLALGVPTPSQHTSCLEHELERIRRSQYRKTMLSEIPEATTSEEVLAGRDKEAGVEEWTGKICRSYSLPLTHEDVEMLPVDDAALSGLGRDHKLRRLSYPLNREDSEDYRPHSLHFDENILELDSATRLTKIVRKMTCEHPIGSFSAESFGIVEGSESSSESSELQVDSDFVCSTSLNVTVSSQKHCSSKKDSQSSVLIVPEWQREAAAALVAGECASDAEEGRKLSNESTDDSEVSGYSAADGGVKSEETKPAGEKKEQVKSRSSSLRESLRKRFSKKTKVNKKASKRQREQVDTDQKKAFTQIEHALRQHLPKTFQTTVQMGLSFDPMTVKERNKSRECDALSPMLAGRQRSKSTVGNQLFAKPKPRQRSGTAGDIFNLSTLIRLPPKQEQQQSSDSKLDEKQGFLDNLLGRSGKSKSTENDTTWSDRPNKPFMAPEILITDEDVPQAHFRKLQKLLGPEFEDCYHKSIEKHRSSSLPLIRKNRLKLDEEKAASLKQLNLKNKHGIKQLFEAFYDSDASNRAESQTDSEASDGQEMPEDRGTWMPTSVGSQQVEAGGECVNTEAAKFVSEAAVFFGHREEERLNVVGNGERLNVVGNGESLDEKLGTIEGEVDRNDISQTVIDDKDQHGFNDIKALQEEVSKAKALQEELNKAKALQEELSKAKALQEELNKAKSGQAAMLHHSVDSNEKSRVKEDSGKTTHVSPTSKRNLSIHSIGKTTVQINAKDSKTTQVTKVFVDNDILGKRRDSNGLSCQINPELVSLKKSKNLKTTQELIAESKVNRERRSSTKEDKIVENNNCIKRDNEIGDSNDSAISMKSSDDVRLGELAELDALLKDLESIIL